MRWHVTAAALTDATTTNAHPALVDPDLFDPTGRWMMHVISSSIPLL